MSTDATGEGVYGPHGLWGVRLLLIIYAPVSALCDISQYTAHIDGRGLVTVYDPQSGRPIANAWLDRAYENEWKQAAQWLSDLVGAKYGIEVMMKGDRNVSPDETP